MELQAPNAAYQNVLETFFEQPLTAFYVIQDGVFTFVSPGFVTFFGYTKEELIGSSPLDLVVPEDRELVRTNIGLRLTGKVSESRYVFRIRHKQGHIKGVEVFARAITLGGRPATSGVLIDVTEKMEYQRRLEEGEAQMRQVFEQSPVPLFVTRLKDNRILYMNSHAEELMQAPRQAVVGRLASDFWQDPADHARLLQAVERDGHARDLEFGYKRSTGEGLTAVISASRTVFDGEPAMIVCVNDISDRKRAEDAVRDSERKLRLLTEHMTDVVWSVDAGLRYTYISPSVERTRGGKPEELLGRHIQEGLTPDSYAKARQLIDAACAAAARGEVRGQSMLRMELQHPRKDGGLADSEVCATLVFDTAGRLEGIHGVTRDIGERKRLQAELHRRATTDDLTGLANRGEFLTRLAAEMERSRRYGRALTVGMLDLDHFKAINDTYGHAAGDAALRLFAKTCLAALRTSDVIGRIGGEEFAVFLPETGLDEAGRVAERLRLAVAAMPVPHDGVTFSIAVSIGLVEVQSGDSPSRSLTKADQALYRAKNAGRNRVVLGATTGSGS